MNIKVKTDGKVLINSGLVNVVWDKDPSVMFDVDGLPITLELNTLPDGATSSTEVVLDSSEKMITITHRLKKTNDKKIEESGVMIPLELAMKSTGEMIYMTWFIVTKTVKEGGFVSVITYSFYEATNE
ncbi:TPA: hypothetical protein U5D93_003490 [Yersinia enterocolitica]|nr:hypothetical protein [Yersinia enterocolitica]HDL8420921.1 hypothetical protein [Yersinia enterocolitica]HEN3302908.1 hypothetical protein [Yersinia enterocolitica]HEN3393368.1 hypothetical protein [Yersinia enterocolitica]